MYSGTIRSTRSLATRATVKMARPSPHLPLATQSRHANQFPLVKQTSNRLHSHISILGSSVMKSQSLNSCRKIFKIRSLNQGTAFQRPAPLSQIPQIRFTTSSPRLNVLNLLTHARQLGTFGFVCNPPPPALWSLRVLRD